MIESQNTNKIVGELVSGDEAGRLLEKCRDQDTLQTGLLSLHHVHCDIRGNVVLIQGGNGEFAVVKQVF